MDELKEWMNVTHGANGATSVTCSLVEGSLSVKWTVKTYTSTIQSGVREARKYARQALADLKDAVEATNRELEEAA